MKKGISWLRSVTLIMVSIGLIYGTGIYGAGILEEPTRKRADVIKIDIMTVFGELEQSPVEFLHDAHTKALAGKKKECTACHIKENDRIYPKFKRLKDEGRIEVMNIYHEGCISCHGELKVAKEKAGPVECDDCHAETDKYVSSRQPMGMDKSLHFRHAKASENKCEQCHHAYDEKKKAFFYDKGREGTCRYCHRNETKDNLISMRLASHIACISCHTQKSTRASVKPPVTCSECHDLSFQKKIKKQTDVPRMDRKQPDIVLLKTGSKDLDIQKAMNRMAFVTFDHKAHENYNNTCRVCHHESMQPCVSCHTLTASLEGPVDVKGVTIEKAMHTVTSVRSCQGCHEEVKKKESCAGCHILMGRRDNLKDETCMKCHATPVAENRGPLNKIAEKRFAENVLNSKIRTAGTFEQEDIPEKITINRLSRLYEAVEFPHRKIVNALVDNIMDNKLAGYFHDKKETICQGCHHHSPVSKRSPQCGHCHGTRWDEENPAKPAIIGAYHQQCMGCHKAMNIEKPTGCTECHKMKKTG